MYTLNAFVLATTIESPGVFGSVYGKARTRVLPNGLALKDCKGEIIKIKTPSAKKDSHLILAYSHLLPNVEAFGDFSRIENETLASRIIDYCGRYHGRVLTNCSSFVEYLRTGCFPHHDDGTFLFVADLIYAYNMGLVRDYHFMYCFGEKNGQPLFISQLGRHDPKLYSERNPIVVSLGMNIGCCPDVPICVYIKRGRG